MIKIWQSGLHISLVQCMAYRAPVSELTKIWFLMVLQFTHMVVLCERGGSVEKGTGAGVVHTTGESRTYDHHRPEPPPVGMDTTPSTWKPLNKTNSLFWDFYGVLFKILLRLGNCLFNPKRLGGGIVEGREEGRGASLEGSGEQGGGSDTHPHRAGGSQREPRTAGPPLMHPASAESLRSKLIWATANSPQPSKTQNPSLEEWFFSIWQVKANCKMTGDEKAAAVEKSQLMEKSQLVEKNQQLKDEKKPNVAAPTEWELILSNQWLCRFWWQCGENKYSNKFVTENVDVAIGLDVSMLMDLFRYKFALRPEELLMLNLLAVMILTC